MSDERYTTYEAKARFSELLKKVREGRTITVTYHGDPVAEIRPIEPETGTAARIRWLESRGVIIPAKREGPVPPESIPHGPARPGALKRFLEDRNE